MNIKPYLWALLFFYKRKICSKTRGKLNSSYSKVSHALKNLVNLGYQFDNFTLTIQQKDCFNQLKYKLKHHFERILRTLSLI